MILIYISDLDDEISTIDVSKFTDDSKVGRLFRSDSDAIVLQADLYRMNEWTDK